MSDNTASDIDLADPRYQVLKNGAVYDHGVKRIVKAPPPENQIIQTSEDGRRMVELRYAKAQATAREAIASKSDSTPDVYGGLLTITKAQADLATNPDKGRASTEAAKWLVRMADLVPDPRQAISAGDKLDAAALDGMRLLFAWLDQQHGPGWRDQLREALRGGADVGDGDSEK